MEVVERDRGVPRKRGPEGTLTRKSRVRGAPREGRLYGVRRLPRSFWSGVLGLFVLIVFFAQLSGDPWRFLAGLGIVAGVTALAVWALVMTPLRATFDQRWRPKRRIEPLLTKGWREVADRLGARYDATRLPRIDGAVCGVAFRLKFHREGGARTTASVVLPEPIGAELRAFPRRARFSTPDDLLTGDDGFDRSWHVICADRTAGRKLLGPRAREWIEAAEPEEVHAVGRTASARITGFVADPDVLQALVLAVAAMGTG
ncbi:MAG: hypothetical protein ACYTDY_08290 [Planctomycetota bacterium]|jgi:hypothetical protein